MDASHQNSPSRKSRFRALGASSHRPASPEDEPSLETDPQATPYVQEEAFHDEPPVEAASPGAPYADEPPPTTVQPEQDNLPAGLRLTRSTERSSSHSSPRSVWPMVTASLLCLTLGVVGGYLLRGQKAGATPAANGTATAAGAGSTLPLNPAVLQEIDASFDANKQGRFADARQRFTDLADKHSGWSSMRIEAARAALYGRDFEGAERILSVMLRTNPNADAEFLMGLLEMTMQAYDKSEAAFGRAVALDPARPDIFYFWGECLRRQGKPQDAADKFHEALIRNQYETTEGLYQLKLWLSEIQADQESSKGSNAKIDADLVSGHPSGPALFAAAARNIKAGQFKEAGERVGQAQKVMEPAVFRVVLQDPVFLQDSFRPELAPFYKP